MNQKPDLTSGKFLIPPEEELNFLLSKAEELIRTIQEAKLPDKAGLEIPAQLPLDLRRESENPAIEIVSNVTSTGEKRGYRDPRGQELIALQTALSKANSEIIHLRLAHLNMIEDVVETGRVIEETSHTLVNQQRKRKKTGNKRKKSEKIFKRLLKASPEALVHMDLEGKLMGFSSLTPELFGENERNELRGKSIWDFVAPGESEKLEKIFTELLASGRIQTAEIRLQKKDGTRFEAEVSLTVVEKRGHQPKAILAIFRDISVRKKMDIQLIHNARLMSLGEMATGIAHEINQPLNTISLSLDNFLYEIKKIESVDKNYFQSKAAKIFDNIYRIRNIIEHIRDFSRYQDDHILVPFDIHKSITNATSMIAEEFRHKEIDLVTDFETAESHVPGNVFKFEQVILNLLVNSKDAIEEKRKQGIPDSRFYVRIHTFSDGDFIFIAVEDNGCGIEDGETEKVFIPFYSTKETGKGTGLGLSISYGIIKEMMGTCEIQSKPGVGTTVLIRLPLTTLSSGSDSVRKDETPDR